MFSQWNVWGAKIQWLKISDQLWLEIQLCFWKVHFKTREVATLYLSSIVDDSASFGYGPRENYLYLVGHCMLQCMAVKLKKPYCYTNHYI